MTYAPPPPSQYAPSPGMPAARTSGAAITSLVTGVIGCLVITPFIAIITGIVGIISTKKPNVKGRGMAIAGLILGVLWLGGIGVFGGAIFAVFANSKAPAAQAKAFTMDLSNDQIPAALAKSEGMSEEELTGLAATIKTWGGVKDITIVAPTVNNNNGKITWKIVGVASFNSTDPKAVEYVIDKKSDDNYKVTGIHFDNKK